MVEKYFLEDLIFNVCQLNSHLASELKHLQDDNKNSRLTSEIRELAIVTSNLTMVLATKVTDINTVIKGSMR